MNIRNYRITKAGYVFFILVILGLTLLTSTFTRSHSSRALLTYKLNEVVENKPDLKFDLSFHTIGDAVLYESKAISSQNLLSFQDDFIKITGQSNELNYESFITKDRLYLKDRAVASWTSLELDQVVSTYTSDSHFNITELMDILFSDWDQIDFNNRHLGQIIKTAYDQGSFDNEELTVKLDIDEAFLLLDKMLVNISEDQKLVSFIQNKYSDFYKVYAHDPLLKDQHLHSRKLFEIMLSLNNNFYDTFHHYLDNNKNELQKLFSEDSYIEIIMIPNENMDIDINARLYYKTCDAYEDIQVKISFQDRKPLNLPTEVSSIEP
ncbi:hypothetical protein EZV73_17760 [Acidaminobacter sp. JC074]|uniref:hypothetical protein n=1 Tax=Acidaminobacter sp. JC074 TaxID=2530199 RepID=UPI001F10F7D0|nr:hypothetical protein [Acidaminobacter sp. JC074]MCH4889432.1 hypothetical protein [Acidaminobacter sp. JC074]